jgi:hypothetical protein
VLIAETAARQKLRALVDPEVRPRVGEPVHLAPDPTRCLLFDPETGLRL